MAPRPSPTSVTPFRQTAASMSSIPPPTKWLPPFPSPTSTSRSASLRIRVASSSQTVPPTSLMSSTPPPTRSSTSSPSATAPPLSQSPQMANSATSPISVATLPQCPLYPSHLTSPPNLAKPH